MKHTTKKRFLGTFLVIVLSLVTYTTQAQDGPPSFGPNTDDETPAAPINRLIGLTFLAGAFFGGKKLKEGNPSKSQKDM